MMPTVSVIIPTYNRRRFLQQALSSVWAQHCSRMEIIVVDDGSTDDTLTSLINKPATLRVVSQPNQGVSKARNAGIDLARGEWLAFLDSDDAWQPLKIKRQLEFLARYPQYLVCHTDEIWLKNGKLINPRAKHQKLGGWIFKDCLPLCRISPSSVMIHRQVFTTIGQFDESLRACEDYEFWLRLTARYSVLYLNQKLTIKQGGHQGQLSKRYWGMDRFRIYALCKILASQVLSTEQIKAAREMLVAKLTIYIKGALKRGKRAEALHYQQLLAEYGLAKYQQALATG